MESVGFNTRSLSFCRSMALCFVGSLLLFGIEPANSQSSLESDVDNARIIEMTHTSPLGGRHFFQAGNHAAPRRNVLKSSSRADH